MADNNSGWSFTTGLLIGSIVGVVAGVLLAPKPGDQTRAELIEQSETWRTRAEELAARVRERVGPTVEMVRERVGPVKDRVPTNVSQTSTSKSKTDGGPNVETNTDDSSGSEAKEV